MNPLQTMRFATLAALASAYQAPPRTCPAVRRLRSPPLRATAAAGDVPATVTTLWRYPIKGFPPDSLASVSLQENGTFPQDRLWAVADATDDGGFDATNPQWVHKQHFFGAFRSRDRLASLNTSFAANGNLTFYGADPVTVDPSTKKGRETIEDIIQRRVGAATKLVTGGEAHQFGNTRSGVRHHGDTRTVHVVNAASVAAVRRATGLDVDAAVFRPNIVVEGLAPWAAVRKSTSELGYLSHCFSTQVGGGKLGRQDNRARRRAAGGHIADGSLRRHQLPSGYRRAVAGRPGPRPGDRRPLPRRRALPRRVCARRAGRHD